MTIRPALLLACLPFAACAPHLAATPAPSPTAMARTTPPQAFTLDTPVERIAANRDGKAVLERDLPGLMASKQYLLFDDMSLSEIATLSSGQLTQSKLNLVEADLSQITPPHP